MKRIGNIFDRVVDSDNLREAFLKASRGKRGRNDQRAFQANLSREISVLREGLLSGNYPVGNYSRFVIADPKRREIYAAEFRERVLHHALMNVCEPYFDRWLISHTYACRKGMGQLKAIAAARMESRRCKWFLKCDIRKFFDNISHEGMVSLLRRKFKDERILYWFEKILSTYETTSGRGLPIGNLTSQHFANLYLDKLDRFVTARCFGYVRYMDDFVLWADDKSLLRSVRDEIGGTVLPDLKLEFKPAPCINRTASGMDFLGARVFPQVVRASRRSIDRYARKMRHYDYLLSSEQISELQYQRKVTALTAFLMHFDTSGYRRQYFGCRREASGSNRVIRGGSYNNDAGNCTSSNCNNNNPSNNNDNNGFRLVCSAAPQGRTAAPVGIQFPEKRDKYTHATSQVASCESHVADSFAYTHRRLAT